MTDKITVLYLVCLFCVMAAIFAFSSQDNNASQALSHSISDRFESIVEKNSSKVFETEEAKTKYFDTLKGKFNSIARKNAHAFLYAMFGLFAMLVFVREGRSEYRAAMYTLFFSMLYAMSDELHQCMVTGRGGKFPDVCVDVFGTALILMIIYAVNRLKKRGKEDNK